jgi:prephenate dehydratase
MKDRKVARAIEELERQCNFVKVLGSYPKSE